MKITQNAKNFGIVDMPMTKIHGQTKIELYNPNTRIKNVYRDENVFQSGMVARYMRGLGQAGQRLTVFDWTNFVGGVLLFRDSITEGTEYMPTGNKMVGNGSYGVVNAGNPTELGSFNEIESSATTSAVTQVYDFSTSQANGTIGCVCLTSQTGGHIGYGNTSGNSFATRKNFYEGRELRGIGKGQGLRNNWRYTFSFESPILTVTKTYIPLTVGSIKAGLSETKTFDMVADYDLPSGGNISNFCQDGRYIYFTDASFLNKAPSETCYYYKYDLDTETLTRESFVNSSSATLQGWYNFTVAHGLAFVNGSTQVEVFDLSNSVLVKENVGGYGYRYAGGLIVMNINNNPYIYDPQNDTIYPTNGAFSLSYNTGYQYFYDETTDTIYNRQYSDDMPVGSNPLYLATINNLQTPVTKTAAQTMKITYTLTEE